MNKDELIARLTLELYEARRNLEATENALRQEREDLRLLENALIKVKATVGYQGHEGNLADVIAEKLGHNQT